MFAVYNCWSTSYMWVIFVNVLTWLVKCILHNQSDPQQRFDIPLNYVAYQMCHRKTSLYMYM